MELFTLGRRLHRARRPRGRARADRLSRSKWSERGFGGIHYEPRSHDTGVKRILGRRGRFDGDDVLDLVCDHPRHAPFLVAKLWELLRRDAADRARRCARWRATYRRSGLQIKPVVRADPRPPGALRATSTRPTWSSAPSSSSPARCARPARAIDRRATWTWLLRRWASSCSTRRRSPAGTGARRGCRRTRCARASTSATTSSTTAGPRVRRAPTSRDARRRAARSTPRSRAIGRRGSRARTRSVLTRLAAHCFDDMTARWRGRGRLARRDAPAHAAPPAARRPRRPAPLSRCHDPPTGCDDFRQTSAAARERWLDARS